MVNANWRGKLGASTIRAHSLGEVRIVRGTQENSFFSWKQLAGKALELLIPRRKIKRISARYNGARSFFKRRR